MTKGKAEAFMVRVFREAAPSMAPNTLAHLKAPGGFDYVFGRCGLAAKVGPWWYAALIGDHGPAFWVGELPWRDARIIVSEGWPAGVKYGTPIDEWSPP